MFINNSNPVQLNRLGTVSTVRLTPLLLQPLNSVYHCVLMTNFIFITALRIINLDGLLH